MSVLVGEKAPDLNVAAVLGNGEVIESFTLSEAIKSKYGLVLFYPLDFTFIYPSELIALGHHIPEFQARSVEVIGVSIDSHFIHNAQRNTPVDKGSIGAVKYILVADTKHEIAKAYDVEPDGGVAFRGAFLVDKEGVVHSQIVSGLPLGRNMDELLRLVDALQFHGEHGEVCPASWEKSGKGMTASPEGVTKYLAENASKL